jgi:hypothetical protein
MSKRTNKGRRRKGLPKLAPKPSGRIEGPLAQFVEHQFRQYALVQTGKIRVVDGTAWEKMDVVLNAKSVIPVADVVSASEPEPERLVAQAEGAFRWLDVLFLDKSVVDEQVGDALEVINRIVRGGKYQRRSLAVWLKIVTTYVWVFMNSIRFKLMSRTGKKAE